MASVLPAPVGLHSASPAAAGERLGGARLLAFSSLAIPVYAAQLPMAVHLPAIYAQHFGLPLATLGFIFLIERLWGAATDPLIGILSDSSRSRFGRRRPWILAGALLYGAASIPLFFPPPGFSSLLLAFSLFIFYLGWSMIQVPYLAWSGEISGRYHERTRVAAYSTVVGSAALLLVLVLPTWIDQIRPGDADLKLTGFGLVLLSSLFVAVPLSLRAFSDSPAPARVQEHIPLRRALALLAGDRLLLRVMGSNFAVTFGQLVRSTLIVFFVTSYMGRPEWASGLFLFQFVFGLAAGPIWAKIGYRFGKHQTAIAGELVQVFINLALLLVTPDRFELLLALTVAQGLAQGSGNLMLRSMVADVADKHRLETGADRTALFFSVFSLTSKAATAAAVGFALPLLAWSGFKPGVQNTPEALTGLLLLFAVVPAIAHAASAWMIRGFPLDEAACAQVRRALDQRAAAPVPAE